MAIAALLAITLNPAVQMLFNRYRPYDFQPAWLAKLATTLFVGKYHKEDDHPISRFLFRIYEPCLSVCFEIQKAGPGNRRCLAARYGSVVYGAGF